MAIRTPSSANRPKPRRTSRCTRRRRKNQKDAHTTTYFPTRIVFLYAILMSVGLVQSLEVWTIPTVIVVGFVFRIIDIAGRLIEEPSIPSIMACLWVRYPEPLKPICAIAYKKNHDLFSSLKMESWCKIILYQEIFHYKNRYFMSKGDFAQIEVLDMCSSTVSVTEGSWGLKMLNQRWKL